MDGFVLDSRKNAIFRCLPSWVPQDNETTLKAEVGNRNKLLTFRCSCQGAKVKVPVTLDGDDADEIGQRFAQSKKLLEHAGCFKLPGGCMMNYAFWH